MTLRLGFTPINNFLMQLQKQKPNFRVYPHICAWWSARLMDKIAAASGIWKHMGRTGDNAKRCAHARNPHASTRKHASVFTYATHSGQLCSRRADCAHKRPECRRTVLERLGRIIRLELMLFTHKCAFGSCVWFGQLVRVFVRACIGVQGINVVLKIKTKYMFRLIVNLYIYKL